MPASVVIDHISKSYKGHKALDDISLSVEKGELFGFIGPDGAGKTTLLRILATLLIPDKGTAMVEGYDTVRDFKKIRKIIGYMPGRFSLYQDLSVEENLHFFASIFKVNAEENYKLIEDIYKQIQPFRDRPAGKLSGGMKQKLALSCALIHKPDVLFLDEPTTGVDAVSRKEFWDMLKKLKDEGITILVSTPYMDEASRCDRVALVQEGQILGTDTPQGIVSAYMDPLLAIKSDKMYELLYDIQDFPGTIRAYRYGEFIHATVTGEEDRDKALKQYLEKEGHQKLVVKKTTPTVEDCFMALMKTAHAPDFPPRLLAKKDNGEGGENQLPT